MSKKSYKQSLKSRRVYKIVGMDCASCATLIEMDLEDEGIKASCSYAKESLEVEFEGNVLDEEKIREIVTKSGYSIN